MDQIQASDKKLQEVGLSPGIPHEFKVNLPGGLTLTLYLLWSVSMLYNRLEMRCSVALHGMEWYSSPPFVVEMSVSNSSPKQ